MEVNESLCSLRLKNTKFCLLEWYSDSIGIPSTVSFEVLQHTFTWTKKENFLNPKKTYDIKLHDDEVITNDWDWDDPDLPHEVIENFEVDMLGLGQELENTYESIEKIEYNDFPKVLRPLVKRSVKEYCEWKQDQK